MPSARRLSILVATAATPLALAYRFARVYRRRAGFPTPHPPAITPADVGLEFESISVTTRDDLILPAWFIPAEGGARGPGVLIVHGWQSGRDRTLPTALILHAAGFHCLTIDIRGHGSNPAESLPITGGEFGADAAAGFDALVARPEVTVGAILGHSMGGIGALIAAAGDPNVAALVVASTPADPWRLTLLTFRLAHLPIPRVVAWPLAWFTARVYLQPRGHSVADVSASEAIARYRGPILLIHGTDDAVVPTDHFFRLRDAALRARAARTARDGSVASPVETLLIEGGEHSWLYEFPTYRREVARFLAETLGGPIPPDEAAARAEAVQATRLQEEVSIFGAEAGAGAVAGEGAVIAEPGGVPSKANIVAANQPAATSPAAVRGQPT